MKVHDPYPKGGHRPVLYHQYPQQNSAQRAFLAIDTRGEGTLGADWDAEIGGAVPMSVWHGLVRRFRIPNNITEDGLHRLLSDPLILALAQRIIDGTEEVWDGRNNVGRANADARKAEDELETILEAISEDDCIPVWDAEEWLSTMTPKEIASELERLACTPKELAALWHYSAIGDRAYVDEGDLLKAINNALSL